MRPALAFIIPRRTARESTNTDLRFVAWMSSHSSSFMRARSLSRVATALLTRIATGPKSAWTWSTKAAHRETSRTSSIRPVPLAPSSASAFEMPSAPFSVVDVPTTVACAPASTRRMPSPMPREAPVTIATCPFSMGPSRLCAGRRERGGILQRDVFDVGNDALAQAREHLSRATLDDALDALAPEQLDGLGPAHRMVELLDQRVADAIGIGVGLDRGVVRHGHHGLARVDRGEPLAQALGRGLHERAVRRRA